MEPSRKGPQSQVESGTNIEGVGDMKVKEGT